MRILATGLVILLSACGQAPQSANEGPTSGIRQARRSGDANATEYFLNLIFAKSSIKYNNYGSGADVFCSGTACGSTISAPIPMLSDPGVEKPHAVASFAGGFFSMPMYASSASAHLVKYDSTGKPVPMNTWITTGNPIIDDDETNIGYPLTQSGGFLGLTHVRDNNKDYLAIFPHNDIIIIDLDKGERVPLNQGTFPLRTHHGIAPNGLAHKYEPVKQQYVALLHPASGADKYTKFVVLENDGTGKPKRWDYTIVDPSGVPIRKNYNELDKHRVELQVSYNEITEKTEVVVLQHEFETPTTNNYFCGSIAAGGIQQCKGGFKLRKHSVELDHTTRKAVITQLDPAF